jgi:transketolase
MGFFKPEELTTFCQDNTRLAGHPDRMIPGIEMDSGSLGQGPGIAAGIALAARLTGRNYRTVVLVGDGECQEGSVWEAANFAGHHRLSNLALIVDRNGQCVLNFTRDCLNLDPLEAKFEACGWRVVTASGHDHGSILKAFEGWKASDHTAPLAVIADTIKGKGISFMEGQLRWHHGVPKGEELELARRELSERDETVVDS